MQPDAHVYIGVCMRKWAATRTTRTEHPRSHLSRDLSSFMTSPEKAVLYAMKAASRLRARTLPRRVRVAAATLLSAASRAAARATAASALARNSADSAVASARNSAAPAAFEFPDVPQHPPVMPIASPPAPAPEPEFDDLEARMRALRGVPDPSTAAAGASDYTDLEARFNALKNR